MRYCDILAAESIKQLELGVSSHEDVSLLEPYEKRPQDLPDAEATFVCVAHDAQRRHVYDDLAPLPLHEVLGNSLIGGESGDACSNAVLDAPDGALVTLDGGLLLGSKNVPDSGKSLSGRLISALVQGTGVVTLTLAHLDPHGAPAFKVHWG